MVTTKFHNETFVARSYGTVFDTVVLYDTIPITDTIKPKEAAYNTTVVETSNTLRSSHTVTLHDTILLNDNDMTMLEEASFKAADTDFVAYLTSEGQELAIKINDKTYSNYHLVIYSVAGNRLIEHSLNSGKSEFDVANLVAGTYFVNLKDEMGISIGTKKFVKQ